MYNEEVAAILEDLDLRGVTIEINWRSRPYLKRVRRVGYTYTTYGHHRYVRQGRSQVTVAMLQPYKEVIGTLAHELRHVWQYHTGKLVRNEAGLDVWEGRLVPKKVEYKHRPEEVDAFAYEAGIFGRILTDKEPELGVGDMFLSAW